MMRKVDAIVCLTTAGVLTAAPAYAYVDPGTGGLLVQLLTGGVAGLVVLVRLYWSQLKARLKRPTAVDGQR